MTLRHSPTRTCPDPGWFLLLAVVVEVLVLEDLKRHVRVRDVDKRRLGVAHDLPQRGERAVVERFLRRGEHARDAQDLQRDVDEDVDEDDEGVATATDEDVPTRRLAASSPRSSTLLGSSSGTASNDDDDDDGSQDDDERGREGANELHGRVRRLVAVVGENKRRRAS